MVSLEDEIMTKQEEKALRRNEILKCILEKPYTQSELMEKMDISKKTLQDDIRFLNDQGYSIPKHSKKNGYVLSDDEKKRIRQKMGDGQGAIVYQSLVSSHIQKTIIMLILQNRNRFMPISEIADEYEDYMNETGGTLKDRQSLVNSISNTLGEKGVGLVSENYAEVKKISELTTEEVSGIPSKHRADMDIRCYRLTKKSPVLLTLEWDTAQDLLSEIRAFGNSYALKDNLKSIEAKLSVALYSDIESVEENYFEVFGNKINRNSEIGLELDKLSEIPFENYAVNVSYRDRSFTFKVGLLVYVADKDKLYMLGQQSDEDGSFSENDTVLLVDRIDDLSITKIPNDIFRNAHYMNLYDEMFSISTEELEHVVVEFDIFGNIPTKFEQLARTRKNAFITLDNEKGIGVYEDDVRGMADFARYLRKYGRSVRVVAPAALKDMMKNTVDRLEERYRQEGLYE